MAGEAIGEAIRLERLRRHWSRSKLADMIGWHKSKLAHQESNRRELKVSEMELFCKAFGMSREELLQAAKEAEHFVKTLREDELSCS